MRDLQPKYLNRQTQGTRLNLTMLAYQEPSPLAKYEPKKEVMVRVYSSVVAVKTDPNTLRKQKAADRKRAMALSKASSRQAYEGIRIRAEYLAKLKEELEGEFDRNDVERVLGKSLKTAERCLQIWRDEGKVKVARKEGNRIFWRLV